MTLGAPKERSDGAGGEAPIRLQNAAESDRRLLTKSSVTFVARAFAKLSQILFLVVAARLLTVDQFASYSYLLVLAAAFTILSDTGVPLVTSRDMATGKASPGELFRAGLPVVALSAVLAALILPVFGAIDSGPGSSIVPVTITAAFVIFNRAFDFISTTLRGIGRFNMVAALEAGGAVVLLAGATAVTAADLGVSAVLAVFCVKELLSAVIGYHALREDLERPFSMKGVSWTRLLRVGIRLSLAGICLALVMRLPLVVLGNTGSSREVALFSAAQRFGDAAILLATTSGYALMPGLAYLATRDLRRARRLVLRMLAALTGIGVVLAAASIPLAEPTMRLIYGSDYAAGSDALQILAGGLPGFVILGLCWYSIIAFSDESRLLWIGLAGLAVSVLLCAVLIPAQGDTGAALAYVGALYVMALLSLVALAQRLMKPVVHDSELVPATAVGAPGI